MTGLPATIMGLSDKIGFLKPGMNADITVFDYDNVADGATFDEPTGKPTGIDMVLVNGELVLDHGVFTENRPGKVMLV